MRGRGREGGFVQGVGLEQGGREIRSLKGVWLGLHQRKDPDKEVHKVACVYMGLGE